MFRVDLLPSHFPHEMAAVKSQLAWSRYRAKTAPGIMPTG